MIPIASLITQVQAARPSDTSDFAEMGDFFQGVTERRLDREQRERFNERQDERMREHEANTTRYYDMQAETGRMNAETHRAVMEDRAEARKAQRVAVLRDALRKAKTPFEKRMILEQIATETGGTIEELPHEQAAAPEPTPEEKAAIMAYTPLGAPPGKLDTNVSKETQGVLTKDAKKSIAGITPPGFDVGAYMASQGVGAASDGPEVATAAGDVEAPPQGSNQMASPPQARSSGRFVLRDDKGRVMQIWDEGEESQQNREVIRQLMEPYIETPSSPEAKAAAERAATSAADLVGTGRISVEKGVELAVQNFNKELDRFKKYGMPSRVGAGGGGGGVPAKLQLQLDKAESDEKDKVIRRVGRDFNQKAADDMVTFATNALDKLELDTGTGDFAGFADWLKSESGKVVTDRERAAFEGAAGLVERIKSNVGRWTTGRFSEGYIREIRQLMEAIRAQVRAKQRELGKRARDELRLAGASREAQAVGYGHFTGDYTVHEDSGPPRRPPPKGAPGAPKPKSEPKPAGDADERKRALLEKAARLTK